MLNRLALLFAILPLRVMAQDTAAVIPENFFYKAGGGISGSTIDTNANLRFYPKITYYQELSYIRGKNIFSLRGAAGAEAFSASTPVEYFYQLAGMYKMFLKKEDLYYYKGGKLYKEPTRYYFAGIGLSMENGVKKGGYLGRGSWSDRRYEEINYNFEPGITIEAGITYFKKSPGYLFYSNINRKAIHLGVIITTSLIN